MFLLFDFNCLSCVVVLMATGLIGTPLRRFLTLVTDLNWKHLNFFCFLKFEFSFIHSRFIFEQYMNFFKVFHLFLIW